MYDKMLLMDKENSILKTVLITLITLISITIVCCLIFWFFFPVTTANICYNLGLYESSASLNIRDYNNTKNINSIAKATDTYIYLQDYEKYIDAFELFYQDENYFAYINDLNTKNYNNKEFNIVTKSSLINENNYYCNYYIKSLIKNDEISKAKSFVLENIVEYSKTQIDYLTPDNYLLSNMVDIKEYSWFIEQNFNNKSILEIIYSNFNIMYEEILLLNNETNIDEIYFLNFSRTSLMIGLDIQEICNNHIQNILSTDNILTLQAKLTELDGIIKEHI